MGICKDKRCLSISQKKDSIIPQNLIYYAGGTDITGIVFTGGEGPDPQALKSLLDSLKTRVLTVAADSGLSLAETAGLRPDWIIGDMDSLDSEDRLLKYPADRVVHCAADKDHTDTELALSLLWEKGCDDTWIMGGGGGRLDHLFGIRDLLERKRFPCRWITAAEDIRCIEAGNTADDAANYGSLTKAVEPGTLVSVFPLGTEPWKAGSRGLKWPLDNVPWARGMFGLSNVAVEEEITVSARQGRFMLIFPYPSGGLF